MKTLLTLLIVIFPFISSAASVTLEWDANSETNLAGYRVYWGKASRSYTHTLTVTNTMAVITNLSTGTNFFAVTAFDTDGLESDFSDEVWTVIKPGKPTGVRIRVVVALQSAPDVSGPWQTDAQFATVDAIEDRQRFYRAKMEMSP